MKSCRYLVHGLVLEVQSDHPALLSAIDSRLRPMPSPGAGPVDIRLSFHRATSPDRHHVGPVPRGARPVYDPPIGTVAYLDAGDELYIEYGDRIRARCQPQKGVAHVSLLESELANPWLVSHAIVTLLLIEMCKRRGLFSLHAAAMALGTDAVLFPGDSGSGKSTLSLALLACGWGFLGDDIVFLRSSHRSELEVCAFPDEVDVSDTTLELIPALKGLPESPRSERGKRSFRPESHFKTDIVWRARPLALLFPRVGETAQSRLVPMDSDDALLAMAPNVLLTEPTSAQSHLDALAGLASACPAYRFEVGGDLDDAVSHVSELFSEVRFCTGT